MKLNSRYVLFILMLLTVSIILSGCIPGDGHNTKEKPAGFFWGYGMVGLHHYPL
jgi:hypothetical protein